MSVSPVFLDTNVIYPIEIRDILLWFAHYDLYTPKWSKHIFDEWENVMRRKNIGEVEIIRRIQTVQEAFPDSFVENYESLIEGLHLADKKDCHVLAAHLVLNVVDTRSPFSTSKVKPFAFEIVKNKISLMSVVLPERKL